MEPAPKRVLEFDTAIKLSEARRNSSASSSACEENAPHKTTRANAATLFGLDEDQEPIAKTQRFADPRADQSFKKLFEDPQHKEILIGFLNQMLRNKDGEEIDHVELSDTENPSFREGGKYSILDVKCHDKNGHNYIVEMQKHITPSGRQGYLKRVQYYAANVYSKQNFQTGQLYEALKPVVLLTISDDTIFEKKKGYWSYHRLQDQDTGDHYLKDLSFAFVELPKVDREKTPEDEEAEWLQLFTTGFKAEEVPESVKSPLVRQAYKVLDMHTWSQTEREAYDRQRLAAIDEEWHLRSQRERGREEGEKIGEERGVKKEKFEMARLMLDDNEPIEKIAKFTRLTEAEIKSLKERETAR